MTLTITASPPLIQVTDTGGQVVLNTTEKLFYGSDRISGSISVPTRTTPFNFTQSYSIGSCNPSSTFVRGSMKVTGYLGSDFGGGVPINQWFNVAGTYVHSQSIYVYQAYTFLVSGGAVTLEERGAARLHNNQFGQVFSIFGFTLSYDLFVGGFI